MLDLANVHGVPICQGRKWHITMRHPRAGILEQSLGQGYGYIVE